MLIDSNAYIGHWPFRMRPYNTCEALLSRMNEFGVDLAIISNLAACLFKNTQTANDALFNEIKSKKSFQKRFIPTAVINPIYGGWQDDLEQSLAQGCIGIKIYPTYHGYDLAEPACIELVEMARDYDLVIAISLRMVDSRPSSWLDINQEWDLADVMPIIRKVPDAKYLIQNAANSMLLSEEDLTIFKNVQCVIDTSGRSISNLPELIHIYGADKFAFGSHSPILDYCTGLLRIESLSTSEAAPGVIKGLRYENIGQLFNL